ncbi:hypothetical protein EDC17_1004139 [Sphingobacterium alimentarium]|uniref:Uncharacterized protein n=1 Tax=Sphingobacterium alimentarium TaxID=797292 RepID=A0A4R3W220_9SPHI|nr:hypothetical protein [Sphingobacterium alimentarium]TCV19617.1 hypothetical protein EDC17_1004139 [Sphingobacterium alimentarium]
MNEQELQTAVKDQQEIVVLMDKRVQQLEKQQSETKDYSAELADIVKKLESNIQDETLVGLKASILKHAKATDSLVTALEQQKKAISEMPQRIKVNVEHRLTGRQRPYVITGAVLVLVSVLSLFASIQLWRSNSALCDSDIKIRMVRLLYPQVSLDIDSIYYNNPKQLRIWVKQEEERLIAIRKAEESARQSTEQAERAKEEVNRLKRTGDKK